MGKRRERNFLSSLSSHLSSFSPLFPPSSFVVSSNLTLVMLPALERDGDEGPIPPSYLPCLGRGVDPCGATGTRRWKGRSSERYVGEREQAAVEKRLHFYRFFLLPLFPLAPRVSYKRLARFCSLAGRVDNAKASTRDQASGKRDAVSGRRDLEMIASKDAADGSVVAGVGRRASSHLLAAEKAS